MFSKGVGAWQNGKRKMENPYPDPGGRDVHAKVAKLYETNALWHPQKKPTTNRTNANCCHLGIDAKPGSLRRPKRRNL